MNISYKIPFVLSTDNIIYSLIEYVSVLRSRDGTNLPQMQINFLEIFYRCGDFFPQHFMFLQTLERCMKTTSEP